MSIYSDDIDVGDSSDDEARSTEVRTRQLVLEQKTCRLPAQPIVGAAQSRDEPCPSPVVNPPRPQLTSMDLRARALDLLDEERYLRSAMYMFDMFGEQQGSENSDLYSPNSCREVKSALVVEEEESAVGLNQKDLAFLRSCLPTLIVTKSSEEQENEDSSSDDCEETFDEEMGTEEEISEKSAEAEESMEDEMDEETRELVELIEEYGGQVGFVKAVKDCLKRKHGEEEENEQEAEGSLEMEEEEDTPQDDVTIEKKGRVCSDGSDGLNVEDILALTQHIKRITSLPYLTPDDWNNEAERTIERFLLEDSPLLSVFFQEGKLQAKLGLPEIPCDYIFCALKLSPEAEIKPETLLRCIQCETVAGNVDEALVTSLCQVKSSIAYHDVNVPKHIRHELSASLLRELAQMTEDRYKMSGLYSIYVPYLAMDKTPQLAAKHSEICVLVQDLINEWYFRINAFVKDQGDGSTETLVNLLDRLEFWKYRYNNLCFLQEQLNSPLFKHLFTILEEIPSTFLPEFCIVCDQLQAAKEEALSNVSFLMYLEAPCHRLNQVTSPLDTLSILPEILTNILVIQSHCAYYSNSRDNVAQLYLDLNYQVIDVCMKSLHFDQIFACQSTRGVEIFHQCIETCCRYRTLFDGIVDIYCHRTGNLWDLDKKVIFKNLEVFIDRCKNMIEVCESLSVFGCLNEKADSPKITFPFSGGQFEESLKECRSQYMKALKTIENHKHAMMEFQSTDWLEHIDHFRNKVFNIELDVQDVINKAFENVLNIEEALDTLQGFYPYYSRPHLRQLCAEKTNQVFLMFEDELKVALKRFEESKCKTNALPSSMGRKLVYSSIRNRIQTLKDKFDARPWLLPVKTARDVYIRYESLANSLDDAMKRLFKDWKQNVPDVDRLLKRNLLVRSSGRPSFLVPDPDPRLLQLLDESSYWKTEYQLPSELDPLLEKLFTIRHTHNAISLLASQYNGMISSLSDQERVLFRVLIKLVDLYLLPVMRLVEWGSDQALSEIYKSLQHIYRTRSFTDDYKQCSVLILEICEAVGRVHMIDIQPNLCLELSELESKLKASRQKAIDLISDYYCKIFNYLLVVREGFEQHLAKMVTHWGRYIERIDSVFEEALRLCVLRALKTMNKLLSGNQVLPSLTLVHVQVMLGKTGLQYSPSIPELLHFHLSVLPDLVLSLKILPRLTDKYGIVIRKKPKYGTAILNDPECKAAQLEIEMEMVQITKGIEQFQEKWTLFENLWSLDKDKFFELYEVQNPDPTQFDKDIRKYNITEVMLSQKVTDYNVRYLLLHAAPLLENLIGHARLWQKRFAYVLTRLGAACVEKVYAYTYEAHRAMTAELASVQELQILDSFHSILVAEAVEKEKEFGFINSIMEVLDKNGVSVPDIMRERKEKLPERWKTYLNTLTIGLDRLLQTKESFKVKFLNVKKNLLVEVAQFNISFFHNYPTTSNIEVPVALEILSQLRHGLDDLKRRFDLLAHDLDILKVVTSNPPEFVMLDSTLESVQSIWNIADDWIRILNLYKNLHIDDINVEQIQQEIEPLYREYSRTLRMYKDKDWEICEHTTKRLRSLWNLLPLISNLKTPTIRKRHWNELRKELKCDFDETAPDFTLGKMVELKFHEFIETIEDLTHTAKKEAEVEEYLKDLQKVWDNMKLKMVPHKPGMYRAESYGHINQTLEDNLTKLGALKSSVYAAPFQDSVDHWERLLSDVMEALELFLLNQRLYIFMEGVVSAEGFRTERNKLAADTYDRVTTALEAMTTRMHHVKNVVSMFNTTNIHETLFTLNQDLEIILRVLEQFLESRRHMFPRFYFISNELMLEILGYSKRPELIMAHYKKLFYNIDRIEFQTSNKPSVPMEALGMYSSEGEYVTFAKPEPAGKKPINDFLLAIEKAMQDCLSLHLVNVLDELKTNPHKRDSWVKKNIGMLCIVASQIQWTANVTVALQKSKLRKSRKSLKSLKKKQTEFLAKFSDAIKGNLSQLQRLKFEAIVTYEIHARDVIEKIYRSRGPKSDVSFEWLSQLRYYLDTAGKVVIKQTNTSFNYGYEYLGNAGRLVITPLTDRCFITLTTALHLYRGVRLQGPTGTGKSETVKDLAKGLAYLIVITNCSEALDYKSLGRMISGLVQQGAWGVFDEFNRINIEVLSVVAQQVLSVFTALSQRKLQLVLDGATIRVRPTVGLILCMNPGYKGRTELPDNLKSMFRPIAVMVPDSKYIAEITLFAGGFDPDNCKVLANKVTTMFYLFNEQMSHQEHYDFGLRGIITVLRYAGRKRKQYSLFREEEILLLSVRDVSYPKIMSDDLVLFNGITSDIFPTVEVPPIDNKLFTNQVKAVLKNMGLEVVDFLITKVTQLLETKISRHTVILVGAPCSAKSTTWRVLKNVKNLCHSQGIEAYGHSVTEYVLNPKALSLGELYGDFDYAKEEWSDGILGDILRKVVSNNDGGEKWILFDGPVDVLWIETMNSLMDDNRLLTLINSERISLPLTASILLEVEDLAAASPSTISRCGIVHNDIGEFGWMPYMTSWLRKCPSDLYRKIISDLVAEHIARILAFRRSICEVVLPLTDLSLVASLCRLLQCFTFGLKSLESLREDEAAYSRYAKLWFLFCMIWGICGTANQQERRMIDGFVREREPIYPPTDLVYEYVVDKKTRGFVHWKEILTDDWTYDPKVPFYKLVVPTYDTLRYEFLFSSLLKTGCPVLIMGPVGTGKTSTASKVIQDLIGSDQYSAFTLNMSAHTSSNQVQDTILSRFKKRAKGVYIPQGNKTLVTFLDDMNMPKREMYGAQPPLELIRQWMDYHFWYDRKKKIMMTLHNMVLLGAMGPPGGGKNLIPNRLSNQFTVINMAFPDKAQIHKVFSTMLYHHLRGFDESVWSCIEGATSATLDVYTGVCAKLLPTPTKIHYLFSLKDISKVFQGLLRSNRRVIKDKASFTRLWIHEVTRVFSDRLVDSKDQEQFSWTLNSSVAKYFDTTLQMIVPITPLVFCDFMSDYGNYEDITDLGVLRSFIIEKLAEYNDAAGALKMDVILFQDAIEHIVRIARVISQPRGHLLLVALGGTGRKSIARLAIYLCGLRLSLVRTEEAAEFLTDLRLLYRQTGVGEHPSGLIYSDSSSSECFEIVSDILSTGDVSNLFSENELDAIKNEIIDNLKKKKLYSRSLDILNHFLNSVISNLRLVICMSAVGFQFRDLLRQYPALINCTTIDWMLDCPEQSLIEVAERFLEGVDILEPIILETEETKDDTRLTNARENEDLPTDVFQKVVRSSMAKVFTLVHTSVSSWSQRMLDEIGRYNYTTLNNYIILVRGYKKMLIEQRHVLSWEANNLRRGVIKIDETKVTVEQMKVYMEDNQVLVENYKRECDDFLVVIMEKKRDTDETAKQLNARSKRIEEEKAECQELAIEAENDLQDAMPAMNEAVEALGALNKKDLTELKSFPRPNPKLMVVLDAVMTLLGCEPTFAEAKKQLGEPKFLESLYEYDKDHIPEKILKKISDFVNLPDFDPEEIGTVSVAAMSLAKWVIAIEKYAQLFKIIAPKKAKLAAVTSSLAEKQEILQKQQREYLELQKTLQEIQNDFEEKLNQKEELNKKTVDLKDSLERATLLLEGLSEEKIRWVDALRTMDERYKYLPGDCLLGTAFLVYLGPFMSHHREALFNIWLEGLRDARVIPYSAEFRPTTFLSTPSIIREWVIHGLPLDNFSTENGLIITQSDRWPLIIDPQGQALKWIKHMEMPNNIEVIDYGTGNYMKNLESAMELGIPVVLQHVTEDIGHSMAPILEKRVVMIYDIPHIKLGDRAFPYNQNFRLFMTTKLINPHYPPEIFAKTAVVNFAIKEEGLEAQLLAIVVRKEKPELENIKDDLVVKISEGKNTLKNLENELLRLLNESSGSLLENSELIDTLHSSKKISKSVNEQLKNSIVTEKEIDKAREGYRPSAVRASILFFVINALSRVDPMYQYSLASYIKLFEASVSRSKMSSQLEERIAHLNEYHTYAVYNDTCQGLFERHKLLFAFLITLKVLTAAGRLVATEVEFLVRGGVVLNRREQPENPCPAWISAKAWDHWSELAKMDGFYGLVQSLEVNQREWNTWYLSAEPENVNLVAPWHTVLDKFQVMLIIRCLRQDRMLFVISDFVSSILGPRFIEPLILDLKNIASVSCSTTPLLFILSPGVDCILALSQVAREFNMEDDFTHLSLGQGQIPMATNLIVEGQKEGKWVFLANCHLSLSWMPKLDKMIESLSESPPHPQFRLWLSSSPHPDFPASILRNSLKITTETPKGIKANMKRLYNNLPPAQFYKCLEHVKYKKLLYALCFLHSILIERKKFQTLGWNVIYSFNDSDFEISETILSSFLDEYKDPSPWAALQYLLAEIVYGGHVTDEWDRRLLRTYSYQLISDRTVSVPQFKLSTLPHYFVPDDGALEFYRDCIDTLPSIDHSAAFGHHPNADITSLITEAEDFFQALISLESDTSEVKGESKEDQVSALASSILSRLPEPMDYHTTDKNLGKDKTPLDIVLLQEIQRYNVLLQSMKSSLEDLEKALLGQIIMSPKLEMIFQCILEGSIPDAWLRSYISLKPLGSWVNDLIERVSHFQSWAATVKAPAVFWLSAFTFPTAFLTAVKQITSRSRRVSIDTLDWEFNPIQEDEDLIPPGPHGVYISGLFLEGAGWSTSKSCLCEPFPLQLIYNMPVLFCKPIEKDPKVRFVPVTNRYSCPLYYTGERMVSIVPVELTSGDEPPEHWVKRGTALLLSLSS